MEIDSNMTIEKSSSHNVNTRTSPELLKEYKSEITLRLPELPALIPVVLPTRSSNPWRRFIEAGQRRTFTLSKSFHIEVEGEALPPNLEGRIVIPPVGSLAIVGTVDKPDDMNQDIDQSADAQANIFDGASIPFPWLVSYLSFGVLRPLGILLVASVVHDFAFQFGYLPIIKNGKCRNVPVQRHEADELFRLITQTLNGSNFFSRLAWHFVRLGWWTIKYADQRFTGEPPIRSTILALIAVAGTLGLGYFVRSTWLADIQDSLIVASALFGTVGFGVGLVYVWIAIESRFRLPRYLREASEKDTSS